MGFNGFTLEDLKDRDYFRLPFAFFESARYKDISLSAKIIYAILKRRTDLSRLKGWRDEEGLIFIYYPRKEMADYIGISEKYVRNCMKELVEKELIREVKLDNDKAIRIYLGKPISKKEDYPENDEILKEFPDADGGTDCPVEGELYYGRPDYSPRDRTDSPPSNKEYSNKEISNNNHINMENQDSPSQNTLIKLPKTSQTSSVNKKLTQREQSLQKIDSGDWQNWSGRDLLFLFERIHNSIMAESIQFPSGRENSILVGIFKNSFLLKFNIQNRDAPKYIEEFIREYHNHPKVQPQYRERIDIRFLERNHWLATEIMAAVQRRLNPIESKYLTKPKSSNNDEFEPIIF